jgi:hypothetical protein
MSRPTSAPVNDSSAAPQVTPPLSDLASTIKQEEADLSTGLTPSPPNGGSHLVNGHSHNASEQIKMHDVSGLCSHSPPFLHYNLTCSLQNLDDKTRAPPSRSLSLPLSLAAVLLHLQHPPSVLSPRPSPHRPPTDLLCIFSVSFVLFCIFSRRSRSEHHGECQYWRAR